MADKNIRSDTDTIYTDIHARKTGKDVSMYELPGHIQGELENPKSVWGLIARGCPRDAGDLAYFELNEDTGVQWYYCKVCATRYTAQELASDALYRIIPEDAVLRYVADMERKGR